MTGRRVWIAQCLCGPNRHTIIALTDEFDDPAGAEALTRQLRASTAKIVRGGVLNPWCGICGSLEDAWRYELGRTRFRTLQEARPELARTEAENLETNRRFGTHGPDRPRRH
jgi:hypothetical protein